jgi:outer membrane protein assembly factor BamB
MTTNETNSRRLDLWRQTARGVGVVALVFSLVVGVLLTTDWMRAGQLNTVRSDELSRLQADARRSPNDADAVALARQEDAIARHAYFSSVAFRNAGMGMLLAGLLVMVSCLHLAARLGRRIEDPRRFPAADQARADRTARLALLLTGVCGLLLLAVWGALDRAPAAPPRAVQPAGGAKPAMAASTGSLATVATVTSTATLAVAATATPVVAKQPDAAALQWSCFRGPRVGVAAATNAPTSWDGKTGAGVLWRVALAKPGLSSPVLWGGKLFLTLADADAREVVAYDAATGRELWRQEVKDGGNGDELPQTSPDTGLGAPTPACDESGVYAVFGTGDLAAYSHEGKLRWQVYLRRPDDDYGYASSLWAGDGKVCVQYDQKADGRVLAVDAKNGQTLWEQKRASGEVWCSPIVVPGTDGKPELLVNGQGVLTAYDLAAGGELWHVDGVTGEEISPSPACWNGHVFVAGGSARMVCYELAAKPVKVWEYTDVLPDVASPVAADGLVFLATSSGQLACVDATSGAGLWTHDCSTGFYASPIVCGNRVYALDRDGTMRIFAAERKFREIATCALGEAADATPAFADGRIYIRSKNTLWCLGSR